MARRFATRESRNVERTRQVARWAEASGCHVRALVDHFGEELGRECGHCSGCGSAGGRSPLPATPHRPLGAEERALAHELAARGHRALAHPRQRARFLCGITSPATTRGKLTRDPAFGALAEHPFLEVLALCEE
jgi:ATP-dependent DNA helicase RecQ